MEHLNWYYRIGKGPEQGVIEISKSVSPRRDKEHVRSLLRVMLNVRRLPNGTQVWPEKSTMAQILRSDVLMDAALSRIEELAKE